MTNLATNLTTTAAKYPEQAALRVNGQGITYAQLHGMAAKVAGALRANGIQPGDRVAIILPNVPAFPVVYWGILLAGGTVVPMNPLLKAGEIDYFFTDSGAKIAFVWPDFVPRRLTEGLENRGRASSSAAPGTLWRAPSTWLRAPRRGGRARRQPHRDHPLHLRDHRAAQGRELSHRNIHSTPSSCNACCSSPPTTSSWSASRSFTSAASSSRLNATTIAGVVWC